jgi:hypothetical protein
LVYLTNVEWLVLISRGVSECHPTNNLTQLNWARHQNHLLGQASQPAHAHGRRPSSGPAALRPLCTPRMISIVAPSPKQKQMDEAVREAIQKTAPNEHFAS